MKTKLNRTVKTWTDHQLTLKAYKWLSLFLSLSSLILAFCVLSQTSRNVVVVERNHNLYKQTKPTTLTEQDLEYFIQNFIRLRYTWPEFDPQSLVAEILPFSTSEFRNNLEKELGNQKADNKPGAHIEQYVGRIRPHITDTQSMASFDRILRVNDVPIVVPMQIALNFVPGSRTSHNPFGLYVHSITEFER